MRFILGVLSALALLGSGAVAYTVANATGYTPAAIYAMVMNKPAQLAETIDADPALVTKTATTAEMGSISQVQARAPENVSPQPAAQMPHKPKPVSGPAQREVAAAKVETPGIASPVIAAPRPIADVETVVAVDIQAAPHLKAITFLSSVDADSPQPPVADRTPADPIEVLYVTGGRVNMRSGPGSRYQWVATLDRGTQLMVVEKGDRWHKVSGLANGTVVRGWMAGNFLSSEPVQVEASNSGN
ncbi:MAG: SH3 domain-containing protein [Marinibacterium sp.]